MATLAELQAQRTQALAEIKRRGGEAKAPQFAQQVHALEAQIRTAQGGAPKAGTPAASNGLITDPVTGKQVQPLVGKNPLSSASAGVAADINVGRQNAEDSIGFQNPNVHTDFGDSTTKVNPDGTVSVNQSLSPDSKKILDQDNALSTAGRGLATDRLTNSGFEQGWNPNYQRGNTDPNGVLNQVFQGLGARGDQDPNGVLNKQFNPNLTARTNTGDVVADRGRIEDQVYGRLTKNFEKDNAKARENLDQYYADRGIPRDPNDPQYAEAVKKLGEQQDSAKLDARAQATQLGGQEYQRSTDINEGMRNNDYGQQSDTARYGLGQQAQNYGQNYQSRDQDFGQSQAVDSQALARQNQGFNQQETRIGNQFGQDQGVRNQNLGEINTLANFGKGLYTPSFQQYQGAATNYTPGTTIQQIIAQLAQGNRGLNIQQQAANKVGGGGGGRSGGQPAQEKDPYAGAFTG